MPIKPQHHKFIEFTGKAIALTLLMTSGCFAGSDTPSNALQRGNVLRGQQAPLAVSRSVPHGGVLSNHTASSPVILDTRSISLQQSKAPANAVQLPSPAARSSEAAEKSGSMTTLDAFVPLCTTLSINTLYTLSGVSAGNAYCYHFEITQKSKTTVLLNGQNASTNFALYLLQDDGLGNLSTVGYSDNSGNADEAITVVTNPGHYYWYMEANVSDGSSVNFGAAVSTPVDNYEPNDTLATASALPDKLNVVIGNSDTSSDYDYYYFTAVRGQTVRIQLSGVTAGTSGKWIMELYNGGTWQALTNDSLIDANGLVANQSVYLRVRPNPSATWSAASQYRLIFGSKPVMSSYYVEGESNVLRVPASAFSPFLTTQAYQQLSWAMSLTDSTGSPLSGLTPTLNVVKRYIPGGTSTSTPFTLTTGPAGSAAGTANLGTCTGDYQAEFTNYSLGYLNTWRTDLNVGWWDLKVAEAQDIGVGGNNYPNVTLGHLCKQTLLSSVQQ